MVSYYYIVEDLFELVARVGNSVGQIQYVGSKFETFEGGFRWICSSILVDEPGFVRVRSSVF